MQNPTLARWFAALTVLILLPRIARHCLNPAPAGNASAPVSIAPVNYFNPSQNGSQ
jgi:hypothetical protein